VRPLKNSEIFSNLQRSFSSNRTLASHFHIDEKQIRQWKKDESKLRSSKEHENGSRKRVEGAGRKPNDPELDEELSTWILLVRLNKECGLT